MTRVQFPEKLKFLFEPHREKAAYGGRGGTKSWNKARALLIHGTGETYFGRPLRILCTRETQKSIAESVHHLLRSQIQELGLDSFYRVQEHSITGENGTGFIFAGLRQQGIVNLKSYEDVDICWVEEAQAVSRRSLEVLRPTIRKPGSEIWYSFNPDEETDPIYQDCVVQKKPGLVAVKIGWEDNPWLSDELRREKDYLYRIDPEAAAHVWGGECRKTSAAQIFKGKYVIEAFEPDPANGWSGPYFGADWGFSQDPTVLVKCWTHGNRIFLEYETYDIGLESDAIDKKFRTIPGADNYTIRADSSRPETISLVRRLGNLRIVPCQKWPGSIEDGIHYLRSVEQIVIHPRCKHAEEEARLYRYKIDKLTGDILRDIEDKHNNVWDAVRYAFEPAIQHDKIWQQTPEHHMPQDDLEALKRAEKLARGEYR